MSRINALGSVVMALLGGIAIGLLTAPRSGRETRRRIVDEARARTQDLEAKLEGLESQIATLQDQLKATQAQIGDRIRGLADEVVPSVPKEGLELDEREIARSLKRMPRS